MEDKRCATEDNFISLSSLMDSSEVSWFHKACLEVMPKNQQTDRVCL